MNFALSIPNEIFMHISSLKKNFLWLCFRISYPPHGRRFDLLNNKNKKKFNKKKV